MMKVYITEYPRLLEEFDYKIYEIYNGERPGYGELLKKFKEWYGYDVIIDDLGTMAYIEMTNENFTMFALRWT